MERFSTIPFVANANLVAPQAVPGRTNLQQLRSDLLIDLQEVILTEVDRKVRLKLETCIEDIQMLRKQVDAAYNVHGATVKLQETLGVPEVAVDRKRKPPLLDLFAQADEFLRYDIIE